ncbi:MAG: helicase [Hyphomicrobiales bacterium]|nr:helicase [Hyphomicrobiales bacterium]
MNLAVHPASLTDPVNRNVTAVLGPTNTGKTHYAIERMLAAPSGLMGLPLRLLAREVYTRVVAQVGVDAVALITGEEKIKPPRARYTIATVEAMPRERATAFVAIDEIQLAADLDRGHLFTDRMLHLRGTHETLLLGAGTMAETVKSLLPGTHIIGRERLSKLSFAGERKLARLPPRSAIVAFSAEEVYAIAEWIRRQKGGAAVVLGALSPRTRNAQVDMYQNGEVDYIVATDAIGMGLNLDIDHIAFAGDRKFDGWHYRRLTRAEFGQIAGRAGRHVRDGTFGTTGRCPPFEEELIEALESHHFDPVSLLQWRNHALDFSSLPDLQASLDRLPRREGLTRAPIAADQMVLEAALRDPEILRIAATPADIARLWDACLIPDYRRLSPSAHADLALTIYRFIVRAGKIPEAWFARQISPLDRVDGDIDALSARIAHVRTWSFVANRADWLKNPEHWQSETRRIEDGLSDALHARLAQRFVDRRTSLLARRLREKTMLEAQVTSAGDVLVEGEHIGQLHGFRFTADTKADPDAARLINSAAAQALAGEIAARATRVNDAVDTAFVLAHDGVLRWLGEPVARLLAGDHILRPRVQVLADEQLSGAALEMVQRRLDLWLAQHITKLLGALGELENNAELQGMARGIGFEVAEALGVLERGKVADNLRTLDHEGRASLRQKGVRFGAYHLFLPALLKPAPRALAAQLWGLKHAHPAAVTEVAEAQAAAIALDIPHLAASGRTSFAVEGPVDKGFYRAAGFKICGTRAVRVDILERLADLIRPAVTYRPGTTPGVPPQGTADGDGFVVTPAMTSLVGCSGDAFASILQALGYEKKSRPGPAITIALLPEAPRQPVKPEGSAEATPEAGSSETPEVDENQLVLDLDAAPEATAPAEEAPLAAAPAEPAPEIPVAAEARPVIMAAEAPDHAATAPEPAPASEMAAPEGPAAPTIDIDVWHPLRHQRQLRRQGGHKGRSHRLNEAGKNRPGEAARPARRPPAKPAPVYQTAPDPEIIRKAEERERAARERRERERKSHEPRNNAAPPRDRPSGGTFASSERPRASERAPDPLSPFAKLAALKARLEGKSES